MNIAMWSGPRNLSTAMMYAFAARGDCAVWDEPFYAAYLSATGIDHPMRDEIIAAHEADPARVALAVLEPTGRFSVLTADAVHEVALTGVRHGDAVREQLAAGGLMAR